MKIGKEWVDVSLRFIKRQSPHKKKTGNPRYTVRIDVSPTTTGSIGVSMDYHTSGLLKLHLLFEKSGAKRWFDNNANEVRDALCGNDITSCTLDTALLNNAADTAPVFKDSPRRERNGGFDIIG